MKDRKPPDVCPVCGEDVPPRAKSCPECGACHESGWNEENSVHEGAGIADDEEFDYDRWLAREEGRGRTPGELHPFWKWTVVLILLAFVALYLFR